MRALRRVHEEAEPEDLEGLARALKSMVGDIVRSRTIQTVKAEIWSKITCYNFIWTIKGSHGF